MIHTMVLSDKQKALLFYALEAMDSALISDEDRKPDFRTEDYFSHYRSEFEKIGNEEELRRLIDRLLSSLC